MLILLKILVLVIVAFALHRLILNYYGIPKRKWKTKPRGTDNAPQEMSLEERMLRERLARLEAQRLKLMSESFYYQSRWLTEYDFERHGRNLKERHSLEVDLQDIREQLMRMKGK